MASDGTLASVEQARRLWRATVRSLWMVLLIALLGGVAAFGVSKAQVPEFRSTAAMYVTAGSEDSTTTAYQGSLASQQRVLSYARLATADVVVRKALEDARLSLPLSAAVSQVAASSTVDTVLLYISATATDKNVASALANGVARSLSDYVRELETPSGGGQPLAKLSLVSPAVPARAPVSPRIVRNVVLGVAAGIVLGLLIVVVRFRFSTKVETENDVSNLALGPVLASIPADSGLAKSGVIDFKAGAAPVAEAFRKLRTNLDFSNVDSPPKVILVTSAVAVEGKTTTAMNLAAALVEAGSRAVLVDSDLRRPQVNTRSGLLGDIGFTNFLRGDGSLNELVQLTQVEGLWILASGPKPPNPAELLASRRAAQAIDELKSSFDYVIVDSPPVLPVTDAVVLSRLVDGVLLVARSGSSKVGDLTDAFEQVSGSKTPVIGFVLTEAPLARARYGYYAISPKQKRSAFGRNREPKAIENVLEPKRASKH